MCAIAGLWMKNEGTAHVSRLVPVLQEMRHRGPDDEGYVVFSRHPVQATPFAGDESRHDFQGAHWRAVGNPSGSVLLGHRRLGILDLSVGGHQPMALENEKLWLVFNGEIYNQLELREELERMGRVFESNSDTEVVLHSWVVWGEGMLDRFNGDWAMALLDLRHEGEPEIFLARDRFGVKPLYYAETEEAFWFASEAKALIGHAVPFVPNDRLVLRYLADDDSPDTGGSETFFANVAMLAPGCKILGSREGFVTSRWYDGRQAPGERSPLPPELAARQLSAHLDRAVALRLRADVPVAACLSGGVDSSSVVGTMNFLKHGIPQPGVSAVGDITTFSAVFHEQGGFNEEAWIDRFIASVRVSSCKTHPDDDRLEEAFDRLVWHQDEPFHGANFFAQWCVMECAHRHGFKVVLSGQGADELFGGYQPGSYQARLLELLGRGDGMAFLREWGARKKVTGISLRELGRELLALIRQNAAKGFRPYPQVADARAHYRQQGLNASSIGRLVKSAEPLKQKLVEEREKLRRLRARKRKNPRDPGLDARIEERREKILSLEIRIDRLEPSWWNLPRAMGRRLRGLPPVSLREHLLTQTLEAILPRILRYEDRNSMAFSVESRVPFLDHHLVEWAFSAADEHKVYRGWTKWVLRQGMEGRVPSEILWRTEKIGFEAPDLTLGRRLLARRKEALAASPVLNHYFEREMMLEICGRVENGVATRSEARLVWRWCVMESWYRQFGQNGQT